MYCVISGPIETYSGYGEHTRSFIRALIKIYPDWNIQIIPQRWGDTPRNYLQDDRDSDLISRILIDPRDKQQPDIWMQFTVPNEFQRVGKYNIGVTAGAETTRPPGIFMEGVNRMDLTIAVSDFIKDTFVHNTYDLYDKRTNQKIKTISLEKTIEVIFEGANTDLYKQIDVPKDNRLVKELNKIEEDFCFLFVGHWLQGGVGHDRKDVGTLIKTFVKTFKNKPKKPALILKTSTGTPSLTDYDLLIKKIEDIRMGEEVPNIYLVHGALTPEEMNILYNHNKVKAMVIPTHGEGFGRPLLEFSLVGKPIITSNWSGHLDFLNKEEATLLPGELKNVHPSVGMKDFLLREAKWFYVDTFYLSKALVEHYKNYQKYKTRALRLMEKNINKFSFDKMCDRIKEVFDNNLPSFPKEMNLVLPKLKKVNIDAKKDTKKELDELMARTK